MDVVGALLSSPVWFSVALAASVVLFLVAGLVLLLMRCRRHQMHWCCLCPMTATFANKYTEVPTSAPHIRVTIASRKLPNSGPRMSTDCGYRRGLIAESFCPPWMDSRSRSVSCTNSPLLYSPADQLTSCSEKINGEQKFLFPPHEMQTYEEDELDTRSVLHYELGAYDKNAVCVRGTLTFALRYDFIHRVLMLHVLRGGKLLAQERDRSVDPYVKISLLPERRNQVKTKIAKKTTEPEFNEMFSFDVSFNELPARMLQFTMYDFDRFTRHGLIGNIIMRDLFDKSDLYTWTEYTMQIVRNQEKNDFGDLLLFLSYSFTEQKLYVTIAKAYNLRPMDITGASDPYVRVEQIYKGRRIKLKKSTCKRANLNPVYHETLEYELPRSQIEETNFLVQVMDWDRIGKDDLLGCCVLGKESPTSEGAHQWENCFTSPVDDKNQRTKPVGQWHSILSEVPEQFRDIRKAKK